MTKVSVNLTERDMAALKSLAESRQITFTQALRQAIATEALLDSEIQSGGRVLLERNGAPARELVFR